MERPIVDSKEAYRSPADKPRFFYGYIVVLAEFFIILMMYGTRVGYGVFFKPMLTEFGWSRALTAGAFSLSMFMQGILGIIMGRFNDKLGPRIVMTSCGFFLGVGYLLMSQIHSAWQLYLFYVILIGIGMGGVFVSIFSTIARWFVRKRSTMTGVVFAGLGIGHVLIPPFANWLISLYDWRLSYVIVGALVLIIVVSMAQLLKRDSGQIGQFPDGSSEPFKPRFSVAGEGVSLREAYINRQFWIIFVMHFCLGVCIVSMAVHMAPHTTDLGISPAIAAGMLSILGVSHMLGGLLMGNLGDRIGNRQIFVICFILTALSLFWLITINNVWMLSIFAFIYGFAGGGAATAESPLVADYFGMRSHGLIFGVMSCGFALGATAGPFITGFIFDLTCSYNLAFLFCAVLSIIGVIMGALLKPVKKPAT